MDPQVFLTIGSFLKWIGLIASPLLLFPLFILVIPKPLHDAGERLANGLDAAIEWALRAAMLAAILLFLLQLIVVIASYALALTATWLSESVIYAFAAMFMLGAASALRDDAHVRVDILRPRFGENGRNWIELAGTYLLLFPICIRLLTTGEQGLARAWSLFEGSRESDGLPLLFLFKTLVPVFAILLILAGLSVALRAALRLTGFEAPVDPASPQERHYGA
ncbi:MAG: TRAP transporter permease DctQ [Henriciella sp.]|jgi:TRAP-type mannitol/chloroaromatic compound transport system permease small subunit|uniref:TRAP transporter small permease subunit n=1 Tax=Henriciella sp. TaxID=1968823 RepID=UPI000C11FFE9|nr:TRAP transporter small permease subunit [Henriciella sp.]MAN75570.1 TRAP transporter permease DctQ [Henriciella sp.]MBF34045.1 TRAP transporter permease DctQ [Hyphomonadaceae bacterium]PHR81759.1 MAG: TRAP transporter permease DctQ [Henriciella sp.]|tara:strand:+ start:260 stop:925 length:666 start_codon:yes stop_codon:yes gene_type:complete